jgi:predicted component of type VI protein secretion system
MVERATIAETLKELISTYETDLESGAVKYEKKQDKKKGGKKKKGGN